MGLTEETHFDLKLGKEYVVYGLTVFLGHVWYYIADESYSSFPVWNPAALFEVTDGSISRYWIAGFQPGGAKADPSLLMAFAEWVNDPTFYTRLTDGDQQATAIFGEYKKRLDIE